MTLLERLGRGPEDRLLIITADTLGCLHATNVGCYQALRDGQATTASLMVPTPWAREAVRGYRGADVGVQLTLNAEFECYRWHAITHAPTLQSGEGGFPRLVADLWEHADTEEVRRECRAQIERAIVWGFDPTHLSSHLAAMVLRPDLFDVYLDLAVEFALPIRLADAGQERSAGFPIRDITADAHVLTPDHLLRVAPGTTAAAAMRSLNELQPGVTEWVCDPAADTAELRAAASDADRRAAELDLLTSQAFADAIESSGAELISYALLRDAQRTS